MPQERSIDIDNKLVLIRVDYNVPIEQAMFEGANKYENYARAYPDLFQHYLFQHYLC